VKSPAQSGEGDSVSCWDPLAAWAQSGLMALSGPAEGPPVIPAFDVLAGFESLVELVRAAAPSDKSLALDARLLTERAYLMELTRGGAVSCNGSCRFIEARDGWIAVNLARESDVQSVAAWIGRDVGDEPWQAIAAAAPFFDKATLVSEGRLLGLAVTEAPLPNERATSRSSLPWSTHAIGAGSGVQRDWDRQPPRVIDLSALWAGPLCGGLLAELGARIIKVESIGRPDSIRTSCPSFFDLLNAGKQSVVIDFADAGDRARLAALIVDSDVVISSARPRAFEQLGLEPAALAERNPSLTWVAITAHGWFGPGRNFVGFGDDAAVAGGLMIWGEEGRPMFAGDAIADPLAGLAATAGALQSLRQGGGKLIDVSLREAASFVARGPALGRQSYNVTQEDGEWCVRSGGRSVSVLSPGARTTTARAVPFGADTQRVLSSRTHDNESMD
jgi:hypothetical protein